MDVHVSNADEEQGAPAVGLEDEGVVAPICTAIKTTEGDAGRIIAKTVGDVGTFHYTFGQPKS